MGHEKLRALLKRHEGMRLKVYTCPSGKLSVGYGRNLEDTGISELEANLLLSNDIERVVAECHLAFPWFISIDSVRQDVIASMVFQMGMGGVMTFKRMIAAMERQDYETAAKEMLDSAWSRQTPARAQELARLMRTGLSVGG